jgi:hypothetical protein
MLLDDQTSRFGSAKVTQPLSTPLIPGLNARHLRQESPEASEEGRERR